MTTVNTDYSSPYLTQAWLDAHKGAAQVLDSNPEFVSFLNSNPDYAKSFTDSAQGAQTAAQAAVDSGIIDNEALGRLCGEASLAQGAMGARDQALFKDYNEYLTADWLQEHPGAALLLSQRPELADFLSANPEAAQDFAEGPEDASKAVEALLAQQPDLGWQLADLVPSGVSAQGSADQGESSGTGSYGNPGELQAGEGYV